MVERCGWTTIAVFAFTVILVLAITAMVVARPLHRHRHGNHGPRHSRVSESGESRPRGQTRGITEDAFHEHMSRVRRFLCRDARPRSIAVPDLVAEIDEEGSWRPAAGELVFPPVTVLHRCENTSGCCLQGEAFSCSPLEMEIVRLVFQVTVLVSGNSNSGEESGSVQQNGHKMRQETIYAKNHTKCACMAMQLPK